MDGELVDDEPVQKERRGVRERGQERGAWLARRVRRINTRDMRRERERERGGLARASYMIEEHEA